MGKGSCMKLNLKEKKEIYLYYILIIILIAPVFFNTNYIRIDSIANFLNDLRLSLYIILSIPFIIVFRQLANDEKSMFEIVINFIYDEKKYLTKTDLLLVKNILIVNEIVLFLICVSYLNGD